MTMIRLAGLSVVAFYTALVGLVLVGLALISLAAAGPAAAQTAPQDETAPNLEFLFEEVVTLGTTVHVGNTARGGRIIIPITGGTFEGPDIAGEVLPMGWDWQLVRADGCIDAEADYFLRTNDGVVLNVFNTATICPEDAETESHAVVTHPVIEAPLGKYEWLSQSALVGTLVPEMAGGVPIAVRIRIYRIR